MCVCDCQIDAVAMEMFGLDTDRALVLAEAEGVRREMASRRHGWKWYVQVEEPGMKKRVLVSVTNKCPVSGSHKIQASERDLVGWMGRRRERGR